MEMDTALDFSKAQPLTLNASISAPKLELNALLTIQSAKIPRAGDDIKISFDDGLVDICYNSSWSVGDNRAYGKLPKHQSGDGESCEKFKIGVAVGSCSSSWIPMND